MTSLSIYLCIFLLLLPQSIRAYPPTRVECDARLETSIHTGLTETRIQCVNVGIDNQPLDVVLSKIPFFDTKTDQVFSFDQISKTVTSLEATAIGNVTIGKNGLASLPSLVHLNLDSERGGRRDFLIIESATEFKNTPKLTSLQLGGFTLSDTSIQALGGLRRKLESLGLHDCSPGKRLLKQVEKFTNLKHNVEFSLMCDDGVMPAAIFQNSASHLKSIRIEFCNLPRITKEMFKGMKNLTFLQLSSSKVSEIEPGAFDDLTSLKYLNLNANRIREVPKGLFEKMRNVMVVDLAKNQIENVSRNDFKNSTYFDYLEVLV